jgi:hypothetical protein
MRKFTPLFSMILLSSLLASTAMARKGHRPDPELGIPTLGSSSNLLSIVLDYDEYSIINAEKAWLQIDLMSSLQDKLYQLGYNSDLRNYGIRSLIVQAKSFAGKGQVRLCEQNSAQPKYDSCLPISQSTLEGYPEIFDNNNVWKSYPLLIANSSNQIKNFNRPIDIELTGRVRLDSITIVLEPLRSLGGNSSELFPPIQPPIDYGVPSFLQGKNIFFNSGSPVQMGDKLKLEKRILGSDDKITFGNTNYVFADFKWVNMTTLENDSVISQINVNCVDERGYDQSFTARNTRGAIIKDIRFKKGKTLAFEIDRSCKYINSVTLIGYSPNLSGSRARITVDLN